MSGVSGLTGALRGVRGVRRVKGLRCVRRVRRVRGVKPVMLVRCVKSFMISISSICLYVLYTYSSDIPPGIIIPIFYAPRSELFRFLEKIFLRLHQRLGCQTEKINTPECRSIYAYKTQSLRNTLSPSGIIGIKN